VDKGAPHQAARHSIPPNYTMTSRRAPRYRSRAMRHGRRRAQRPRLIKEGVAGLFLRCQLVGAATVIVMTLLCDAL
jgi:hypothetical protein